MYISSMPISCHVVFTLDLDYAVNLTLTSQRLVNNKQGLDKNAPSSFAGKQGVISLSRRLKLMACHKYIKRKKAPIYQVFAISDDAKHCRHLKFAVLCSQRLQCFSARMILQPIAVFSLVVNFALDSHDDRQSFAVKTSLHRPRAFVLPPSVLARK